MTNLISAAGLKRLEDEYHYLWRVERPKVCQGVSDAAAEGDRSENAEYIYGKKRLREIDRRIRFLTRRLDLAEIVDPATRQECVDQVFFGADESVGYPLCHVPCSRRGKAIWCVFRARQGCVKSKWSASLM